MASEEQKIINLCGIEFKTQRKSNLEPQALVSKDGHPLNAFGLPHHHIDRSFVANGITMIRAKHEDAGPWNFYSIDGKDGWFCGKHYLTLGIEEEKYSNLFPQQSFLLARTGQFFGDWAAYSIDGSDKNFHGPHYSVLGFLTDCNPIRLVAQNRKDDLWNLVFETGDICPQYGFPHHRVERILDHESGWLIQAKHNKNGQTGLYAYSGDYSAFGGPFHLIYWPMQIDGVDYISAIKNKQDPCRLYAVSGNTPDFFGIGVNHYAAISQTVLIESEGTAGDTAKNTYLRVCGKHTGDQLIASRDGTLFVNEEFVKRRITLDDIMKNNENYQNYAAKK